VVKSGNELREHGKYTLQQLFARLDPLGSTGIFRYQCVKAGSTFRGRSPRIVEELRSRLLATSSVTFRNVEQRRQTCPVQLPTNFCGVPVFSLDFHQ